MTAVLRKAALQTTLTVAAAVTRGTTSRRALQSRALISAWQEQQRGARMSSSSANPLASSSCKPCTASSEPIDPSSYATHLSKLDAASESSSSSDVTTAPAGAGEEAKTWTIDTYEPIAPAGVSVLKREFKFRNFKTAQAFAQRVGNEVAEVEKHHPALITEWGKVTVLWWTHAISGLHENDFICAAKTDVIASTSQGLKK